MHEIAITLWPIVATSGRTGIRIGLRDKFVSLAGIRLTCSEILIFAYSHTGRMRIPGSTETGLLAGCLTDGTTMTVPALDAAVSSHFTIGRSVRWWDADAKCTVVVSQPSVERELWASYIAGARRSYRKHGVEHALDMAEIGDGDSTALFFAAVDETGRVVGGVRAKGPYRSADDSHAVVEWRGQPGQDAVRKMINDRLPFGVVEMKTAWVTDEADRNRPLTKTLARTAFPTMALLDCQFLMATAATHVLDSWRSSGGLVASRIPATPYPDARYRTKIMWWDRRTFVNLAEPQQAAKIVAEMKQLTHLLDGYAQSESSS